MEAGRVVFSKAGRDSGKPFIVVASEGEYLFLADGRCRLYQKPKKKKIRHVQPTNAVIMEIKYKTDNDIIINDADLKKALAPFKKVNHKEA